MNAAHTPGPWASFKTVEGIEISVANDSPADKRHANKQWICAMNHRCSWVPPEEVEANARLIASAPDLLAALERIVEINGSTGGPASMVAEFKHIAAAAIAKAKGEAQ